MLDKPLFIIITLYALSISLLGAQYMADSYGLTLRAPDGTAIAPNIIDFTDIASINAKTSSVKNLNQTQFTLDPVFAGASLALTLFQILTGALIFNLLYLFGMPTIFIVAISIPYWLLLINTLIAKIRGV